MNNEIIISLLAKKKHWKRKQVFYHALFHKYERRSKIFSFALLLNYLFTYLSISLKLNKWIVIFFLFFFLVSSFFYVYFIGYSCDYNRKLEKTIIAINQINEKLIEIMVSCQITNPAA